MREKILLCGEPAVGKTLSIRMLASSIPGKVGVIDPDDGVTKCAEEFGGLVQLVQVASSLCR